MTRQDMLKQEILEKTKEYYELIMQVGYLMLKKCSI